MDPTTNTLSFQSTNLVTGAVFPVQPFHSFQQPSAAATHIINFNIQASYSSSLPVIQPDTYFAGAAMHGGATAISNVSNYPITSLVSSQPFQPVVTMTFHNLGPAAAAAPAPISWGETGKKAAGKKRRRFRNVLEMKRTTKGYKLTSIIKGQWTPEEDRALRKLVDRFGVKKWSKIGQWMPGRLGKQCRERWINHLQPNIKKDVWSEEEEAILIETHKKIGNHWAAIARKLPGRTDNTVKNHWNATKRKQSDNNKGRNTKSRSLLLKNYIKSVLAPPPPPPAAEDRKMKAPAVDTDTAPAELDVSDYNSGAGWGTNHDVFGSNMFGGSDEIGTRFLGGQSSCNLDFFDLLPEISSDGGGASSSSFPKDMDLWEMIAERGLH